MTRSWIPDFAAVAAATATLTIAADYVIGIPVNTTSMLVIVFGTTILLRQSRSVLGHDQLFQCRRALTECRDLFEFYGDNHSYKAAAAGRDGDRERADDARAKARRNYDQVRRIDALLSDLPGEER